MYQWLLADLLRPKGHQAYVQWTSNQEPWLAEFPALTPLTLRGRLRITDKRLLRLGQGFGSDFSRKELMSFCRRRLLTSASFERRLAGTTDLRAEDTVTINVRRGDYYGSENEPEFGMRIVPYIEVALAAQRERGAIKRVQIVSDDLVWCHEHLAPAFKGIESSYERRGSGAFADLGALAASSRLILANSTFSYWGAYLATARGADPADIVAPAFHQRAFGAHRPWFHDPEWTIVETLPGGWQPEPGNAKHHA